MIRAILFDIDGTLLHTMGAIKMSGDRAIERFGHPTLPYDKYKEYIGDGPRMLMQRALAYYGDTNEKHLDTAEKSFSDFLRRNSNAGVEQFVGLYDVVRDFKENGLKLAVLTNKDQRAAEGNIQRFFGLDLFDRISGFKEGFVPKPAPDEALKLAAELDVRPEECVMVGDSPQDVLVAKNAGMHAIAVLWGYRSKDVLKEAGADYFAQEYEDLPKIIEAINHTQ